MKHIIYIAAALMLFASCGKEIKIEKRTQEAAVIFPDYKDVTVPYNIAPLDFCVADSGDTRLCISAEGKSIWVKGADGDFDIPADEWKEMLQSNKGGTVKFTVCVKRNGEWCALRPFDIFIAAEPVDSYIVYRLIPPGYEVWNEMGIYQRCLENFDQSEIISNRLTDKNCMNCHSFCMQNPDKMLFHSRAANAGTMLIDNGKIEKLNTKTPGAISALVYPSWHPSGKYVAFSTNETRQTYFANDKNRIEVYDIQSDDKVYDVSHHQILTCPQLSSTSAFETFPTFSPDGRSLYFCSAAAVDSMPKDYKKVHYSLCRISFNPEKGTFGDRVDTLYNSRKNARSVSFPRVSPDGKYLVFTLHNYGNFSIWHHEADLYAVNLHSGDIFPLTAANSRDTESYHSWSHNSRWLVFSSRRINGLYTRPFITYIDKSGKARKPFLLPQRNPKKYYADLMFSYNIPEFVVSKVIVNRRKLVDMMKNDKGIDVK